ncbi:MAG: hypothetical protein COA79_11695 [Planctomycetota bacterium]|nr:MAG: hypothetical protein COA79_11695 [Planctomycetota bacterium]
MAYKYSNQLFQEDWSAFKRGPINRDVTARGEYMTMLVPANPNGWYHSALPKGNKTIDNNHSPFIIKKSSTGNFLELPQRTFAHSNVMTTGYKPWQNFEISASIKLNDHLPVGLVVRYETNNDYYSLLIESGVVKIIRNFEGHLVVLASQSVSKTKKTLSFKFRAEGNLLTGSVAGIKLKAEDSCISEGGFGLLCNGACKIGKLNVKTYSKEKERIEKLNKKNVAHLVKIQKKYPAMELLKEVNIKGYSLGRQIRFADLSGDGTTDLLFGIPTKFQGKKWTYDQLSKLSALNLEGELLWERGSIKKDSSRITSDLPFQVADRGFGTEIVACFGHDIEIIHSASGNTIKKVKLPKAPKMEPYWDEINMYWGSGHGDDMPNLLADSLMFANFTGRHEYGDLFIKDRYHNGWGIDGKTLKPLWHHRCNTGHFPFVTDLTGDGLDDVVMGYSRVNNKGQLMGRIYLGDHPDGCFSYVDTDGHRHNLHPSGEAGFIDEYDDYRISEVHLGHVQHLSIGNFIPDKPDLERIIVTYHGNEGIIVLMDMNNRVLRKIEKYGAGSICQPVNWTGDGKELIAFSARHGDGGLWDENFDLVVPFPNDDRPGQYLEVHDMLGLGYDQIIVWDEEKLHVYGPAKKPKKNGKVYMPKRPGPHTSNYQVNFSLPAWQ